MNKGLHILVFLAVLSFCRWDLYGQAKTNRTIDSLLIVLESSKEDTNKVNTLNELANQNRLINNMNIAKEFGEKSIQLAGILGFKKGKAGAHFFCGLIEKNNGNYQKAMQHFQSAKTINENAGYRADVAANLMTIGGLYMEQGKLAEALKCSQSALKIQEEIGNKQGQMAANGGIGVFLGNMGNYTGALKYFLASLKLARELKNNIVIASNIRNVANVYVYEGNLPEALKYANESLGIFRANDHKHGEALVLSLLGTIYEKQGKHDESMHAFLQSLKVHEERGEKRAIAIMHNQIGLICISKENYAKALEHHQAALKIREEINDKWGIAESYGNIASVLSIEGGLLKAPASQKKYEDAIKYAKKAIPLVKEVGAKATELGLYDVMSVIYTRMGDYKNALEYYQLQLKLKDSLMNNETTRKLEQIRTQFEVEKAVNNEKANNEKAIEIEKMKHQFALAEDQAKQGQLFAIQQFENDSKLAHENARHQQIITDERTRQKIKDAEAKAILEKERAEKKRRIEAYLSGLIGLALISIFTIIIIRQRNQKRRAIEKAEAGHKMAELELQSLRAQLNPHFMFNSLNAIQDLILKEDNDKSHLYLSRFSKLLRMMLDNSNQPFVTIKQELELLELYLSLENLRIPNLQYSIEQDLKKHVAERMIPNMMLQPYIENAIWHGLSNKKGERKLQIRIHEDQNTTEFEVEDNGIGRKRAAALKQQFRHGHHSRGMQLLSKRFELLSKEYGSSIQTTISDIEENNDATGTLVKIVIPFTLSEQAKRSANDTNNSN